MRYLYLHARARIYQQVTFWIFPAAFIGRRTQPDGQTRTSITPRTRSHRLRPHRDDRPPASATHRPDVAVRIRPQLARSVPLRVHPPSADGSYIPHAPIRKNQQRTTKQSCACASTHTLPARSGCWVQISAGLTRSDQPSSVTSACSDGSRSDRQNRSAAAAAGAEFACGAAQLFAWTNAAAARRNAACSRVRVRDSLLPCCRLKSSAWDPNGQFYGVTWLITWFKI